MLNAPLSVLFPFLFMASFVFNSLALLVSSLAQRDKSSYVVAYTFLLVGFVLQVFLANPNSLNAFYRAHWFFTCLRQVLEFYPGFNYTKIWSDIV